MMNDFIVFPRKADDLFVHIPAMLNQHYLEEVLCRNLGKSVQIRKCQSKNVCANMFGGTACSGATVVSLHLELSNSETLDIIAKILSPDPVNLYKIDCRYDSRISEIRWTRWWSSRNKPWLPVIFDTRLDPMRREFWVLREFFPRVGWQDVQEGNWGHFKLDHDRLRLMVEMVAEMHAESNSAIEELRQLFPEPGIRYGGECRFAELEKALDDVIADKELFRTIGIGEEERDSIKAYCDCLAERPRWLDDWKTVCVSADLKPGNLAFRSNDANQPVLFDFGAARLAPMEEELSLLLNRLSADDDLTEVVLNWYLGRFAELTGESITVKDFRRRLPWAEPLMLLRSLVEQADALRWVPCQDRSKGYIRYFIQAVGKQLNQCIK